MRQRDDLPFAVALNNMATGSMTPEGIQLLQSRVTLLTSTELTNLRNNSDLPRIFNTGRPEYPILLFHSNLAVNNANEKILLKTPGEGAFSTAFDTVLGNRRSRTAVDSLFRSANEETPVHQTKGLRKKILLKISGKYMMTVNKIILTA